MVTATAEQIQNLLRQYLEEQHPHQITSVYHTGFEELVALNNVVTVDLNKMSRFLAERLR